MGKIMLFYSTNSDLPTVWKRQQMLKRVARKGALAARKAYNDELYAMAEKAILPSSSLTVYEEYLNHWEAWKEKEEMVYGAYEALKPYSDGNHVGAIDDELWHIAEDVVNDIDG